MSNSLPSPIKKALIENDVSFILRGWPGLGRVMQGVSLAQILKKFNKNQNQVFYSSERGFKYLNKLSYDVHDIGTGVVKNLLLGGIGNSKIYSLIETIEKNPPSAIVIDGELQLMPILKSIYDGPIIALANAFDICNPKHSKGKKLVFRSYYHSCDFVIIGSLTPVNESQIPDSFPERLCISPFVRSEIYSPDDYLFNKSSYDVVVVLGGGTHGSIALKSLNNKIIDRIHHVAASHPERKFTLFGVDDDSNGNSKNVCYGSIDDCSNAIIGSKLVIARSGRNIISEVLALKKQAILVPPIDTGDESDVHRSYEQQENATNAEKLSTGIYLWNSDSIEVLQQIFDKSIDTKPEVIDWKAGNMIFEMAIA